MSHISTPAIWLIVLIIGLPQLSETVYTPSLPAIAETLKVKESWIEYTLTIYLLSFGAGTLFWGRLSDRHGRKPCMLIGLLIYVLGSLGCHFSDSYTLLMLSRFVQGFGGSVGSVLGQSVCRDTFQGPALAKAYASIGCSLALFPALGPLIGGFITQHWGWPAIFLFLIFFGCFVVIAAYFKLPETLSQNKRKMTKLLPLFITLCKDTKVISYGLLVGGCLGISFSYYAEGPFYFIETLGLSPSEYGRTFILIAAVSVIGSLTSRKLQSYRTGEQIVKYGLILMLCTSLAWTMFIASLPFINLSQRWIIAISLNAIAFIMTGIAMVTPNTLSLALKDYQYAVGSASSLFGCYYCLLVSLFTFGMGMLHNCTLLPMPLYFFVISGIMTGICHFIFSKKTKI